ncbi:MAG: phage terminase small subunit P27 family [Methanoregula sp.]|uniref:phage terminase small subunit P27 family n=1 Tax=Methanoregula sp. TaxID=2052170 RepID=UPI003D11FF8A
MIPGPKPKPAAVRNLAGRSHHKQNTEEPQPARLRRVPPAPRWLGEEARAKWKELAGQLYELGVLTAVDQDALARYCLVWGRFRKAERHVRKEGEITKTPNGYPQQSPWLAIINKCLGQLASLGAEFGLSPSSRTRVKGNPSEEEDKLEQELFGPKVKVTKRKQ